MSIQSMTDVLELPDPSLSLPKQDALAGLLILADDQQGRQKLFDVAALDADCQDIFMLGWAFGTAWRRVAGPCLRKYATCLAGYNFCSLDSDDVITARADIGLRTIGIRLQLVRIAEAFWAEFQSPDRYLTIEKQHAAAYTAHLFSIMVWTLLRSCQRDLGILRTLAESTAEDSIKTISVLSKVDLYSILLRKMMSARIASRRRALCSPGDERETRAIEKSLVKIMGAARDGVGNVVADMTKALNEANGADRVPMSQLWKAVGDGVLGKWETLVEMNVMKRDEAGDQFTILMTTCVLLNRL